MINKGGRCNLHILHCYCYTCYSKSLNRLASSILYVYCASSVLTKQAIKINLNVFRRASKKRAKEGCLVTSSFQQASADSSFFCHCTEAECNLGVGSTLFLPRSISHNLVHGSTYLFHLSRYLVRKSLAAMLIDLPALTQLS